jgi:RNA polymerase sigma factor (sigma-70 family)
MNSNDIELLRRYVFERSEEAFADLVQQRIALVYSAALRQLDGDAHLAEEVTQSVFTDLARKAPGLTRHVSLAGWLYTSTRYSAAAIRRANLRRSIREQKAHAMSQLLQPAGYDPSWEEIRPILDEAMHDLKAEEREAVLLRFFDRQPLAEVGARFGVSENTARMRVVRAMDKLRAALVNRGVTSTTLALAAVLTGHAMVATPTQLGATVSRTALVSVASASGLSLLLARLLMPMKIKLVAGAALLAVAIVLPILHLHHAEKNRLPDLRPAMSAVTSPLPSESVFSNDGRQGNSITTPTIHSNVLRLTILAADVNKPLPGVEIHSTATKGAQPVRNVFLSSSKGISDVLYPEDIDSIELVTQTAGFADTILHWEPAKGDIVPTNYTLRLVRAAHIGGYVQEEDGSPVPGIKVEFGRNTAPRVVDPAVVLAHENREYKWIETVTDAKGRWGLDRIAPDMIARTIGLIRDPDHISKFEVFDGIETQKLLREDAFVFKLNRTPSVHGMVTDIQGNPIAEAKVVVGQMGQSGAPKKTTTSSDGSFVAKTGQLEATSITFTAPGFVSKVVKFEPGNDALPLRIVLEQGRILKLKVIDQIGHSVSNATISANLEKVMPALLATTDRNGTAMLREAPNGAMGLYIAADGCQGTNVSLISDNTEHPVTIIRETSIFGIVSDAATGQPIPAFRVICGTPRNFSYGNTNIFTPSENSDDWQRFGGGKFRLEMARFLESDDYARKNGFMLKLEADGYSPCVSRVIKASETEVQLDFALVPAQAVKVTVLNPNGRPAADAQVGLLGQQVPITLSAAQIKSDLSTVVLKADSRGVVTLLPDDDIKRVIAINAQGFAESTPAALALQPTLQLQPFGRLEGLWLIGNQPAAGRKLLILPQFGVDDALSVDSALVSVTTDNEGRFVFPQLPPGNYRTLANSEDNRLPSTWMSDVVVRPGETSTVTIGYYLVSVRLRWPNDIAFGKQLQVFVQMQIGPLRSPRTMLDSNLLSKLSLLPEVESSRKDTQLLSDAGLLGLQPGKLVPIVSFELSERENGSWAAEGVQPGASYTIQAVGVDTSATNIVAFGWKSVLVPSAPANGSVDVGEIVLRRVEVTADTDQKQKGRF